MTTGKKVKAHVLTRVFVLTVILEAGNNAVPFEFTCVFFLRRAKSCSMYNVDHLREFGFDISFGNKDLKLSQQRRKFRYFF